jgi:NADH-quinone oxidoreductase subunit J
MIAIFYISALVAIAATALAISRRHAVHALLYLIVSLLAAAVVFFTLGAPFVAALEVIIYAGAIMVLFIFVIMMLNLGPHTVAQEGRWLTPGIWTGPCLLAAILLVEVIFVCARSRGLVTSPTEVPPAEVGLALFGPYLVGVELASMLLLAGLVGAYHLGRRLKAAPAGEAKP